MKNTGMNSKMIRRLIALLLILVLALSGCRSKSEEKQESPISRDDSGTATGKTKPGEMILFNDADGSSESATATDETASNSIDSTASSEPEAAVGKGSDTAPVSEAASDAAAGDVLKGDAAADEETCESAHTEEAKAPLVKESGAPSDAADYGGLSGGADDASYDITTALDGAISLTDSKLGTLERYAGGPSDDGAFLTGGDTFFDEDAPGDDIEIPDPFDPVEPIEEPVFIKPAAGLLTAGEWCDNAHFDFLKNLIANGQSQDYSSFFKAWGLTPFSRLAIHVASGDASVVSGQSIDTTNVENALVTVYSSDDRVIWQSKTDNRGMTYAFYRLTGGDAIPSRAEVSAPGAETVVKEIASFDLLDENVMEIVVTNAASTQKKLDLMFVIDTTGSMGDEISYLQKELENVIERVQKDNSNIPVRLSVNFYRDNGDEYVVRSNPFTSDINSQLIKLNAEQADGGGDYEEAVEQALEDAVNAHDWDQDSTKLMFMVLDAPPHNTSAVRPQLASALYEAASKGIRIIPVASSGVDKSTEFLLRTFAMTTGGTYTFLTNHSGIGDAHIEPTIGDYEVENLNDLLVRLISGYLTR